jgi:hypothetical protein
MCSLLKLWSSGPKPAVQINDDIVSEYPSAEIDPKVLNVRLCVKHNRAGRSGSGGAIDKAGLIGNIMQDALHFRDVSVRAARDAILLDIQGVAGTKEKCDENQSAHET